MHILNKDSKGQRYLTKSEIVRDITKNKSGDIGNVSWIHDDDD